jgi:pilus assembly protein CpaF
MPIRVWYNSFYEARERRHRDFDASPVTVGRDPSNDLQLDHPMVPQFAATLVRNGVGWAIEAESFDWVEIDNRRLNKGETIPLDARQVVSIFPFAISFTLEGEDDAKALRWETLDGELATLLRQLHRQLLDVMGGKELDQKSLKDVSVMRQFEQDIEALAEALNLFTEPKRALLDHAAGQAVRNHILWLKSTRRSDKPSGATAWTESEQVAELVSTIPQREDELTRAATEISSSLSPGEEFERAFWPAWEQAMPRLRADLIRYLALKNIKKEIKDSVFGYGPLEDLLRTPSVTEIMVVDSTRIYVERDGRVEKSGRRFVSDEVTENVIKRIVERVNRRIDFSRPLVDARLRDGSRVNAVIPPIAVSGPCLTIRKFAARKLGVEDLIRTGALTDTVAQFLNAAVRVGANILVSGGTGTGKTTLLNCLSDYIPNEERIITIEDTAELRLKKDHVVSLEAKEENVEKTGAFTIRDLVKNALRMRPNRIIVGECRGAEALDMLQAMNTGHAGSMTTIHANNAEDAVARLEVLVALAANLPVESIRQQIVSAIDFIVQLQRDGARRVVTQVAEVVEIDSVTGRVRTKDIFAASRRMPKSVIAAAGAAGSSAPESSAASATAVLAPSPAETDEPLVLRPTGQLPTMMPKLITRGYLNLDAFY